MHIFELWDMGKEPALMIGMDIIGLMDTVVIDYRRRELQIRPSSRGQSSTGILHQPGAASRF
jgi:hypothetical protein